MPTLKLKGPAVNSWFAERIIEDKGPEGALNDTCGPMRRAVQQVIANQGLKVDYSIVEPNDD